MSDHPRPGAPRPGPHRAAPRPPRRACPGRAASLAAALAAVALAGCPGGPDLAAPAVGTVRPVRGPVALPGGATATARRVGPGDAVAADGGLARLALDGGAALLLDRGARVTPTGAAALRLDAGRVWVETGDAALTIDAPGGRRLELGAGAAASLTVAAGGDLHAHVLRGALGWARGGDDGPRGRVEGGHRLALPADGPASAEPAYLWTDWTGGVAAARPVGRRAPPGMGVLEARVPGEVGEARWPLVVRRLDVRVRVVGDLALTEVEQVFFNPAGETVEGRYRLRVPDGAVLERFAVDREGVLVDGAAKERAQARRAYDAQVYRGSTDDPALLEWTAPGAYEARIYPIPGGATRRIVVRWAEWLVDRPGAGPRLYRYPLGAGVDAPRIEELSFVADLTESGTRAVRAPAGARVDVDGHVTLRASDVRPTADLWLELGPAVGPDAARADARGWRGPHTPPRRAPGSRAIPDEDGEEDYWAAPVVVPAAALGVDAAGAEGVDLVVVVDVSAGTDPARFELARRAVAALFAHLGPGDRVALVGADLALRPIAAERITLGPADPARLEGLLDALARAPGGGATDLARVLTDAAGPLEPGRDGAVVYVGDGAPTVGALGADALLAALDGLPSPLRLYALGVGEDADLELLSALTAGDGLALRVEDGADAAAAALDVLAHLARPAFQRVTVTLSPQAEGVYPRRPVDLVAGAPLSVVARVAQGDPVPTRITLEGLVRGAPRTVTLDVETRDAPVPEDLRLRWAQARLAQLLLEGGTREEVVDVGLRYGVLTPFTSLYVPSVREVRQRPAFWGAGPALVAPPGERLAWARDLGPLLLGPLALTGCEASGREEATAPPPPGEPEPSEVVDEARLEDDVAAAEEVAREAYAEQQQAKSLRATASAEGAAGGYGGGGADGLDDAPTGGDAEPGAEPEGAAVPGDIAGLLGTGRGGGGTGSGTIGLGGLGSGQGAGKAGGPEASGAPDDAEASKPRAARRQRPSGLRRSGGALDALLDLDGDPLAGDGDTEDAAEARAAAARDDARSARVVVSTTVELRERPHRPRRCSEASRLPLDDRRALWAERLATLDGAGAWLAALRDASRACELPGWRDRRRFLDAILARAGRVPAMLQVWQASVGGEAAYLRKAILRRVRTAADLRAVRDAFGLDAAVAWDVVEDLLAAAATPDARVARLEALLEQYPDHPELVARLLAAYEEAGRGAAARRYADRLRADPATDPGLRTAIGELLLRQGDEAEARRAFSEMVEFAPRDPAARRRLGDLYRAHGWFDDAYRQYETLLDLRPEDDTVVLLLAQAAAGAGRVDEALRLEQRVAETAEPGRARGLARVALLWSSVRFATLRAEAVAGGDPAGLESLDRRRRRAGVLGVARGLRVALVWSHPDAGLSLWVQPPDAIAATRPGDLAPTLGLEAYEDAGPLPGAYRIEVRRAEPDGRRLGPVAATLVVLIGEGTPDERIVLVPVAFDTGESGEEATRVFTLGEDGALVPGEAAP